MGKIYSQAERVVVWLEDSTKEDLEFVRWGSQTSRSLFVHQTNALLALSRKKYWNRLWIVQEVILARKIIIQCGFGTAQWDDIYSIMEHCYKDEPSEPKFYFPQHDHPLEIKPTRLSRLAVCCIERIDAQPSHILELISHHGLSECADTRDRVFGLLGAVRGCCSQAIKVQYECDPPIIHHQVMEHWFAHHGRFSQGEFLTTSALVCAVLGAGSVYALEETVSLIDAVTTTRLEKSPQILFWSEQRTWTRRLNYIPAGVRTADDSNYISMRQETVGEPFMALCWKFNKSEQENVIQFDGSDAARKMHNITNSVIHNVLKQLKLGLRWSILSKSAPTDTTLTL